MTAVEKSPYLEMLKDRIDLVAIPFSERGSRLMVFRTGNTFSVRLAERWLKLSHQLTAYRERPALIDQWMFTDGEETPLELDITTYPHKIEARSRLGTFHLVFLDEETLFVHFPAGKVGMTFQSRMDKARVDRRGGVLGLVGDIRRNVAYTSNARLLLNELTPQGQDVIALRLLLESDSGSGLLLNITPRLGFNRHIPPAEEVLERAARRWVDWFEAAPKVAEEYSTQYYFAWWIMRAGLISPRFYITREAMAPSKIRYVGVWQWDAYFHALAYRHVNMQLAQDQLRIMIDHQREDGMIPDAVHDEGTVTHLDSPVNADVTKPPLLAWAAWKLYEQDGDAEFLNEIYEPVVRWNKWWFEYNDIDHDGLCEYEHPFSSGLDDSPLWDEGMPVESPDLNTYLVLQQEALGRIAGVIGEKADAKMWEQRASELMQRMLEQEWDAGTGLFWANHSGVRVNVRTPFSLFPLLTGRLSAEVSRGLVDHLTNEHEFWSRYPVPTVAMDDPMYDPMRMWRGPAWINVNYLLIEGLQRSGYPEVARELRRRTLDLVCGREDIYEYYNPETGERPLQAASTFGWSAAMFIDLAIQAARER